MQRRLLVKIAHSRKFRPLQPEPRLPIEAALRWRSQFAPEPARYFLRLHRIIDQLFHTLINVPANGAFEGSDVKAGRAESDQCQPRRGFALRTGWPVKNTHDVVPYIRREAQRSQSPVGAVTGTVMGRSLHVLVGTCWSIQITSRKS